MKREELMINDIVFDYTKTPVKVCAVGQDIVVKNGFGVGALDPNELSPIPLTEEILVKNGFERCDYNNKYFFIDDVIDLITPKWRSGTEYYACAWYQDEFDDLVQHIEICKCAYVHQLQHLLRLCGIEKSIIL